MHYRFLVTFNKDEADSSIEARSYVMDDLQENGFTGVGRWGGGLADWFVIGGRWSGELTRALLDQEKLAHVEEAFEQQHGWWIGGHEHVTEDIRREQMRAIFDRAFPDFTGDMPFWRDQYESYGYEDDAMVLTSALYDALLKAYEGQEDTDEHADLDDEPVSPDMIGKKWVVVVDTPNQRGGGHSPAFCGARQAYAENDVRHGAARAAPDTTPSPSAVADGATSPCRVAVRSPSPKERTPLGTDA
jgi:hypothetical protein